MLYVNKCGTWYKHPKELPKENFKEFSVVIGLLSPHNTLLLKGTTWDAHELCALNPEELDEWEEQND